VLGAVVALLVVEFDVEVVSELEVVVVVVGVLELAEVSAEFDRLEDQGELNTWLSADCIKPVRVPPLEGDAAVAPSVSSVVLSVVVVVVC